MVRSFLIVLAILVGTTAYAQEGVPKFVQGLSSEDYAVWAAWQNRQAKLRAAEESEAAEEPYIYAVRTTSSVNGGVTAALNLLNRTNRGKRNSATWSTATNNMSTRCFTVVETTRRRYVNPDYRPPGSVTIHNPYARFKNNVGTPIWDKLFVPCKTGTMTVTEALKAAHAPVSAERLFSEVMSDWFK